MVLRFGLFVGPDSDLTLAERRGRARGDLPEPRPARRVPADALARRRRRRGRRRARRAAGIYNVADDDPPTRAEIDAALAAAVGRDALRPALDDVPPGSSRWRARSASRNRRLREATGWAPRVRGGTEGWRLIAERPLAA